MSAGAALVLAAGAFAWWAWDRGLVPGNPRAVSKAAMQPALLRHLMTAPRGAQGGCVAPELAFPRPELQGQEGIAQRPLPGQFAVTLLAEVAAAEQPARERQLAQLRYLAQQGFFAEAETPLLAAGGARPARRYVLTWKGYAEAGAQHQGAPCFRVGEPAFESIEGLEKLPQRLAGLEAWTVAYRTGVRDVPGWAASDEARALFPGLKGRTEPAVGKAMLLRGDDGWLSQGEARLQLLEARPTGAGTRHVAELRARSTAPALEPAAARAALEDYLAGDAWGRRGAAACLPVRLPRGGDERAAAPDGEFRVTFYDLPRATRPAYSRGAMVSVLHTLHALEAAGMASSGPSGAGEVSFGRVKVRAKSGVRYVVRAEALEALGVGRGNPCIPVGVLKLELLAARASGPGLAQLAARARASGAPDWALRAAEHLPALKLALAEGIPVSGQLAHTEQGWRVVALVPHYPEVQSHSVPAPLRRLLPQTEAAHPVLQ